MAIAPLRPRGPSRERLCRTALRLFAERGYDGVSNRQIVEACGLTRGAIYWYFEGKEDLFATVVGEALQRFEARVRGALGGPGSWDERLGAAMRLLVDTLENEDDPDRDVLLLLVRRSSRGPGVDRLIGGVQTGLMEWVEAIVTEHLGGSDGREVASLVHAAGLGVLVQAGAGRSVARPVLSALYRLLTGGELYGAGR